MRNWLPATILVAVACSDTPPRQTPPAPPPVDEGPAAPLRHAPRTSRRVRAVDAPVDARSERDRAIAACWGADGAWHCNGARPAVGSTSSPVLPSSWGVGAWCVDPQNVSGVASDHNACTSCSAPCRTFQEINVHRLGCLGNPIACPRLRQATILTFLSSHTDNTDPVVLAEQHENGGYLVVQCAAPTATAATFTLSTAKSQAAGSNALLSGSFSAGSPAVGMLVQNTTAGKISRAFVHASLGGGVWQLTQPFVLQSAPTTVINPPEVDTWATGDTVNLLAPCQINIARFTPTIADATVDNYAYIYQAIVFDPAGPNANGIRLNGLVQSEEVTFQRGVDMITEQGSIASAAMGHDVAFLNDYFLSGIFGTASTDEVIVIGGGTDNFTSFAGEVAIDGDYVAGGFGLNFNANTTAAIGNVYLGCNSYALDGSTLYFGVGSYAGSPKLYGAAGKNLNLRGRSLATISGTTFTQAWTAPSLISPGILLNGQSQACSHTNANNPDVANCNISTTPAHLDAAQGVAGFGGTAYRPGGASVSNAYQ